MRRKRNIGSALNPAPAPVAAMPVTERNGKKIVVDCPSCERVTPGRRNKSNWNKADYTCLVCNSEAELAVTTESSINRPSGGDLIRIPTVTAHELSLHYHDVIHDNSDDIGYEARDLGDGWVCRYDVFLKRPIWFRKSSRYYIDRNDTTIEEIVNAIEEEFEEEDDPEEEDEDGIAI